MGELFWGAAIISQYETGVYQTALTSDRFVKLGLRRTYFHYLLHAIRCHYTLWIWFPRPTGSGFTSRVENLGHRAGVSDQFCVYRNADTN